MCKCICIQLKMMGWGFSYSLSTSRLTSSAHGAANSGQSFLPPLCGRD